MRMLLFTLSVALWAQAPMNVIAKVYDGDLSTIESELVPLVEAMPEGKFGFAPKEGEFKGARTFAQQAMHIASVNYLVASTMLGEKNPVDMGENENGPASVKTKAEVVKFVKESFAYTHKAMRQLTEASLTEMIPNAFSPKSKSPRAAMASIPVWHSFDHYGQMVIYARMNGVIPPASRR
ncbi:MAG: DinB family protein [Bryobacteraceae bacterium]|nr:DinB family protein [Bryobacteraceae bacterium]